MSAFKFFKTSVKNRFVLPWLWVVAGLRDGWSNSLVGVK